MLTKERLYIIMNMVKENSFVTVKELTEALNVSRSSVMRDLAELEQQGLIQREHGGAIAKNTLSGLNEAPVVSKETLYVEEKKRICAEAAKQIKDGDCIYIDSGTTPVYLLEHIVHKRITVVSASTYLIRKLPESFRGDIYLLGGEFHNGHDMSSGPLTLEMIRQFNFDHAFFSTNGVNPQTGEVTIFAFAIGAVKKAIMERSLCNDLLIDASKFEIKALSTWAHMSDFHKIYTDALPKSVKKAKNICVCE